VCVCVCVCAESACGPAVFYEVQSSSSSSSVASSSSTDTSPPAPFVRLTAIGSFNVFEGGTLPAVRTLGDCNLAVASSSGSSTRVHRVDVTQLASRGFLAAVRAATPRTLPPFHTSPRYARTLPTSIDVLP
jgi:hypothetical protein